MLILAIIIGVISIITSLICFGIYTYIYECEYIFKDKKIFKYLNVFLIIGCMCALLFSAMITLIIVFVS